MNRAFIFTMDAVLALIPVFIIVAAVSQIGGSETLHSWGLIREERVAQDVLEVMIARKNTEETNESVVTQVLQTLVPSYYNYSYQLEYNGSILVNVTHGNLSAAKDISVAKRLDFIKLYKLLGVIAQVSHSGSSVAEELCPRNGNNPPIYESSFYIASGDFDKFNYYLEGIAEDAGVRAWYAIYSSQQTCDDLRGGSWTSFMTAADTYAKVQLDESLLIEGQDNYVYIKVSANPKREGSFYVIRAPSNIGQDLVTYSNAIKRQFAWVTLKIWRE
jgi:hypothetical protein